MKTARCCEQGKCRIVGGSEWRLLAPLDAEHAKAWDWHTPVLYACCVIRFCPFCGHDLSSPCPPQRPAPGDNALPRWLEAFLAAGGPPVRICFDVDGVLADHRGGRPYQDREPYDWVASLLTRLKAAGHELVMQTARYMAKYNGNQDKARAAGLLELRDWLRKWDIPHDEIYLGKCSADIYVDDKGCRVESDKGITDWAGNFAATLIETQNRKKAA